MDSVFAELDSVFAAGRSGSATPRDQPFDAEKVYRISGTDVSFSCNTSDLDDKAVETIRQINQTRRHAVELRDDFFKMEPQHIPEGDRLFLTIGLSLKKFSFNAKWKPYGPAFGYGIGHKFGYKGLKLSFVHRNPKTKWIMNIYHMIVDNRIKFTDIYLCHVFQSDGNYNPRPKRVPSFVDFDPIKLNSRVSELETLQMDPKAFRDFDEFGENLGADPSRIANGKSGKGSKAWDDFTKIQVLGPDGVVVLTLAICHRCSIAYKTGYMNDSGRFNNNGTKTLKEHIDKCSGQMHIARNPH